MSLLVRVSCAIGLGIVAILPVCRPAIADVISATPTLPVLGVPYISSTGIGCFTTAGVCIAAGEIELTSLVSSIFDSIGQHIRTNAVFSGVITTIGGTPIGPVNLSGFLDQEVLGRTSSTELGSWTTDLIDLDLTGPLLGHTLTLTLDDSNASTGVSTITQPGDHALYDVDTSFSVFTDLSLDSSPPLTAERGPLDFAPQTVPEPLSVLLLAPALLALIGVKWLSAT